MWENFIAFGNDQNDIELFKTSLYSVQIGDFAGLTPYADDTLELKENLLQQWQLKSYRPLRNLRENSVEGGSPSFYVE